MLLTWTNREYTWKCILKAHSNFSLCVVCNYSYFSNSGGINFACRLIMLPVWEEWILCWIGGLWVFTRSGESKALFNWKNESITAVVLLSEKALWNEQVIYCGQSKAQRILIEEVYSGSKNIKSTKMQVDFLIIHLTRMNPFMGPSLQFWGNNLSILYFYPHWWWQKQRTFLCHSSYPKVHTLINP